MYAEADRVEIKRQIVRCAAILAVVLLLLCAGCAVAIIKRMRGAALALAALTGAAAVFGVGFYLLPRLRYRAFLIDMREGLSREMAGTIVEISDRPEPRDGARVLPVRLFLDAERDERIVYLNASKRALFPEAGAKVRVKLFGRHIKEVVRE